MELGRDKHQHRKHPIMKPLKRITKVILLITLCTLTILLVTKLYQGYYYSSDMNNNYGALYKGELNLRYFSRYSTRTKAKLTSSSLLRNGEGGSNRTSLPCSNHTHIQSTEDMYRNLVYVTAFSDNHFDEAQDMLVSVQKCLPGKKMIIYDLDLNDENVKHLTSTFRNVEIRKFPFQDYKHILHVSFLLTFAWKPIIVKLVSLEYDVIMYGDASMRIKSCDITKPLEHLLKFPFFGSHPVGARVIEFVHPGMIDYLKFPQRRKDMKDVPVLEANSWMMWVNPSTCEKLIEPWLDCALHRECITPRGAKLRPCHFTNDHDGHFIECHRFDQAALNLILAREYGIDAVFKASNKALSDPIWSIRRS